MSGNSTLVEHEAPEKLLAQRGLFAGPSQIVSEDLYAEISQGIADRERHRLVVHPHATVSMNTYFGRFPATYWQRWCVSGEVELSLTLTGSGTVSIVASDAEGETRTIVAEQVSGADARVVTMSAKIDKFTDGGALWFDVVTGEHQLVVEDPRWTVAPPKKVRPTAIVICTFNRVEDCLNTMAALASDPEPLSLVDAVYVVDQGSDPVESRPRFAEVAAALGEKLRYIRQPNLGGAGGFTRGLYEVMEVDHAEHANVLFMDDDVLCEPEIVVRTTAFANRTAQPVIVGGQMLYLLHPNHLHVGAEYANLDTLAPGQVVEGALHDADLTGYDEETGKRNVQDRRVDAGYNGWWSCLIPSEIVKAVGYPLPLFFQWDDIEYGYRARAHGFATVTLPGAGVWHADFHWKDWDDWHRYFNLRNALVTSALHSQFDPKRICRSMAAQLATYLVGMQYGLAATQLKAIEDFLKGPEVLRDGGVQAAADIRKLRAEYPETVKHPASEVPGISSGDLPLISAPPAPRLFAPVLAKRVVNQLLGRSVHDVGAVAAGDSAWWHVSLFNTAVVTDASQEGVRVRRRDRELAIRLGKQGTKLLKELYQRAPEMQRAYRDAMDELTSRENWRRLYDL
ncbi:galactofuranosylgalactofuranosylrhamnosyl-N-acetylglucosaminyl-diphospho-decaprenol beta-1,5/1,6-galactofuranosyltransferase [Saccharothrix carnea]|uniref:Galactofuranosylgalactofuranosylrhamnosyl-N-acetylglucosaminyl-diphospho-decaprenol beta-1,5/1,6-galactofuranosyltransferase n=1 Tax=Saccharothrix carnea TaxID=1280637 RepID=A0A2P8IAL1_SACCR|nr:glycosyltransferase [Saccharothrix carnea]PSL55499.1 galactofuranosylgalactofuranosylrhamnosyl-N-acetylglucosaminyl-diphospho-decaprenol beta-1,5/1,6-galactofuranosyltransferase [Saccharothrix carnea]